MPTSQLSSTSMPVDSVKGTVSGRAKRKEAFYKSITTEGLETIQGHLKADSVSLKEELDETNDNLLWIGLELKKRG